MSSIKKMKRKFIYFAIVSAIALSLCPINPLFAKPNTPNHDGTSHSECIPNLCATVTAKETFSPEKILASFSWLSLPLLLLYFGSLNPEYRNGLLRFDDKNVPPKFANKLYRLHAAFLI